MPPTYRLETVDSKIAARIEPFLMEMDINIPEPIQSIYVTGPAARGEFSERNPEINLLLVFDSISSKLLDHVSLMGRKYGRSGIRAPLLLTREYLANAADSFPVELLELKNSHIPIYGPDLLADLQISQKDLRLQCERALRLWRLQLRQAYLSSAGDAAWLNEWFINSVAEVFPLMRAILHLLSGDADCGNTETVTRLGDLCAVDLSAFADAWNKRKNGLRFDKKAVFEQFDLWETALSKLVSKIDALEIR